SSRGNGDPVPRWLRDSRVFLSLPAETRNRYCCIHRGIRLTFRCRNAPRETDALPSRESLQPLASEPRLGRQGTTVDSLCVRRCAYGMLLSWAVQFSDGLSTLSITRILTGPFADSSFRPSWSRRA